MDGWRFESRKQDEAQMVAPQYKKCLLRSTSFSFGDVYGSTYYIPPTSCTLLTLKKLLLKSSINMIFSFRERKGQASKKHEKGKGEREQRWPGSWLLGLAVAGRVYNENIHMA